ncbi:peptidoglycan editing factor PgeF [Permianibacter aggregans]|uniref:Purine nucleoside phosphorylase n=1 Tax=Permianibacter aggregans TaxID=1510150 RepID=A0A4R6UZQ7_9GAMM|nr:peptidoglycan editing factor PgeF [Permianibacter aggregans]QGX41348.1 peptidoglycan editing factor PgeF [Permianibacter aggregans]TDQ51135.1 hypothetical protein EV696_101105 [Permianibacter aggregans]
MNERSASLIAADWPAPPNVHAFATTRLGGFSAGAFAGLNLAEHVGDESTHVAQNRRWLRDALNLPAEPHWLQQVHGGDCARLPGEARKADAAFTETTGQVCAVMTADCLPVLFCDQKGSWVAAAHAGWRGLATGVLENTIASYPGSPEHLMAWFGPAIGPKAFEVGPEVRQAFIGQDVASEAAFEKGAGDRYFADLFQLARLRLQAAGVMAVYGGGLCTYSDPERFFSYRRDAVTGRQASLIWMGAPER